jgi:hypothetical protein
MSLGSLGWLCRVDVLVAAHVSNPVFKFLLRMNCASCFVRLVGTRLLKPLALLLLLSTAGSKPIDWY